MRPFAVALALACITPACRHAGPQWWRGEIFYEVFVRSFADSDGDGTGDLAGLTAKLDYIRELGAGGIWLMPIHPSPSYHGYDVLDYRAVHPDYGSLERFEELAREADRRGIRVILDLVINHSSDRHPWFQTRPDWYSWRAAPLPWSRPWDGAPVWHEKNGRWYFALFWSGMPDLNLANPAVEAELIEVMKFWLARGAAGFRIDAARHLIEGAKGELVDTPETHALISRMRARVTEEYPETLLVAEAWTGTEALAAYRREYHLAFAFELASAIKTALKDGQRVELVSALRRSEQAIVDRGFEAPFLSNHDMVRVMRVFGGDAARAHLAAAVLFALPGTPFVYYGEELGMQGGAEKGDEAKRTRMPWTPGAEEAAGVDVESQERDPRSLLHRYRALGALRKKEPALAKGEAKVLVSERERGVLAIARRFRGREVLFVANVGEVAANDVELLDGVREVLHAQGLSGRRLAPRGFAFVVR